ncbi:thioredoxin family protein [Rufibacter sp. LB8]|uniref:thioredoxin family protein n=1 Tax=Rufibacter sp. LB8 TaxID=2777781 RepID=UPI00178C51B9|nr:thioredoxin family protein [Rufibacter sp. LB8]
MRYFAFIIISALALASCSTARQARITAATHTGLKAHENREEKAADGKDSLLIGPTTRVAFEKARYSTWFHPTYLRYKPNEKLMEELVPLLEGVTIKAFIGSWCLDSQRELPRLFKILDAARIPYSRMEMTSLREDKSALNNEDKTYSITAVPTFILYKDGKEVGRIVETAYPTLEMNMITLLKEAKK